MAHRHLTIRQRFNFQSVSAPPARWLFHSSMTNADTGPSKWSNSKQESIMGKKSVEQVKTEIQEFYPDALKYTPGYHAGNFMDLVRVGALLSDQETCLLYLSLLNEFLVNEVERVVWLKGVPKSRPSPLERLTQKDIASRTAKGVEYGTKEIDKETAQFDKTRIPKFHGALQTVLRNMENQMGFNGVGTGVLDGEIEQFANTYNSVTVKGATPTLKGFMHPNTFNDVLLKQGFHFKDPGAGIAHGEFSHRIQWFIIMCAHLLGRNGYTIRTEPLKLYALCGAIKTKYWTKAAREKNSFGSQYGENSDFFDLSLFAYLCDCTTKSNTSVGPKAETGDFRCPELLNSRLISPAAAEDSGLYMLNNFLSARNTKRSFYEVRDRQSEFETGIDKKIKPHNISQGVGLKEVEAQGEALWFKKY